MAKRKALSKKTRFEIFKRDKFTCQYCGAKSPEAVLVVDHMNPVAKGGRNDLLNLVTSCQPCNAGKGARELGDGAEVEKQRSQLEELQERREQLEMMMAWKRGLLDIDGDVAKELASVWEKLVPGYSLNDACRHRLGALASKYGAAETMGAIKTSVDQYLRFSGDPPKPTHESANRSLHAISGVLYTTEIERKKPWIHDLYKLRGYAEKKLNRFIKLEATKLLDRALGLGVDVENLWDINHEHERWRDWCDALVAISQEHEYEGDK